MAWSGLVCVSLLSPCTLGGVSSPLREQLLRCPLSPCFQDCACVRACECVVCASLFLSQRVSAGPWSQVAQHQHGMREIDVKARARARNECVSDFCCLECQRGGKERASERGGNRASERASEANQFSITSFIHYIFVAFRKCINTKPCATASL